MPVAPTPKNQPRRGEPRPESLPQFDPASIGTPSLRQTGGYIHEEFLRELRGEAGLRKLREMAENDFVCGAVIFAVSTLIKGVQWTLQAADDTVEAEAGQAFADEVLFQDLGHSWHDFIGEVCSMLTYGFAPIEIVWKRRSGPTTDRTTRSKFDDGRIGIRLLSLRAQETIYQWDIDDEDGQIRGLYQQPINGGQVYIPDVKFLLFRTSRDRNNPLGRSILRAAYRSWYLKSKIEEIEAIGVERDLAGLPIVTLPAQYMRIDADPADRAIYAAYKTLVTNVRRDRQEGIIMPSDRDKDGNLLFEFKLLSSGGSRTLDTNKVLTRYDRAIATAVLADFIFLGQQAVGSFALSSDKTALFAQAVQSILVAIAETINTELLPRLWYLNALPIETMPKIVPGQVEQAALGEISAFVSQLASAGMPMFPDRDLANHLRRMAGLPPEPEEGIAMETPDGPQPGDDGEPDDGEAADDGADEADDEAEDDALAKLRAMIGELFTKKDTKAGAGHWADQPRHPAGAPDGRGGEFAPTAGSGASGGADAGAIKASIEHYTGAGYRQINGALRSGSAMPDDVAKHVANLDAAMADAALPEPVTVYRGVTSLGTQQLEAQGIKKGAILKDPGFVSTSRDYNVARQFATQSRNYLIMEIKVPRGAKAIDVAQLSATSAGEKEILFARNSALKVVSFDKKSRKVVVEMIDPDKVKKARETVETVGGGDATSRFVDDMIGIQVIDAGDGEPIDFGMEDDDA